MMKKRSATNPAQRTKGSVYMPGAELQRFKLVTWTPQDQKVAEEGLATAAQRAAAVRKGRPARTG